MWVPAQTPPEVSAPAPAPTPAPPPALVPDAPGRPAWDLTLALIGATVQLDQPDGQGTRTVGAGFLIDAPRPDGTPRTVLVTAAHVLNQMPGQTMRIGWRTALPDGSWKFDPQPAAIRAPDDQPIWTRHPDRDIAVMEITAPDAFARAAIPLGWLADQNTLAAYQVGPGDELFSLGFPRGLSSNRAGFPILRVGRVASWPLSPVTAFPTFLLDFTVFPGNSGGPIFWTPAARTIPGKAEPQHPFIAGVLAQEVKVGDERLDLGVAVHAVHVREAISLLDAPPWP